MNNKEDNYVKKGDIFMLNKGGIQNSFKEIFTSFIKVAATMAIAVAVTVAQDMTWYSNNTTKDTFYISTEEHIKGLAQLVNNYSFNFSRKTIILKADVTLTEKHVPIGNNSTKANVFAGKFDGSKHSISNLSVSGVAYAGLFGYLSEGQIKNLTINVNEITAIGINDDNPYAGGLAGVYESPKPIENCGVNIKDSIKAFSSESHSYSGGLVGRVDGGYNLTISNSYSKGNVSSSSDSKSDSFSGGLVGQVRSGYHSSNGYRNGSTIQIDNSYATGKIFGSYSGGLVGKGNGTISNSYSMGDISGSYCSGGLSGEGDYTINNCYSRGNISSSCSLSFASNNFGAYGVDTYSGGLIGTGNEGSGSNGTISNSYATGNISSYSFSNSKHSASSSCSGGLVGQGKVTINNSYASGNVSSSSTSSKSSESCSGGLVGYGGREIEINSSYASGNVSSSISTVISSSSTIIGFGSFSISGGLVGNNVKEIKKSYATGNVSSSAVSNSSESYSYSGGLVGSNGKEIINSYASGNISSTSSTTDSYSGGLVGEGDSKSEITNSYSSGKVSANGGNAGGIFGELDSHKGSVSFVFYNSESVGKAIGKGEQSGGIGLTSEQLKKQGSFIGWDFAKVWGIDPNKNNGFPYLRK